MNHFWINLEMSCFFVFWCFFVFHQWVFRSWASQLGPLWCHRGSSFWWGLGHPCPICGSSSWTAGISRRRLHRGHWWCAELLGWEDNSSVGVRKNLEGCENRVNYIKGLKLLWHAHVTLCHQCTSVQGWCTFPQWRCAASHRSSEHRWPQDTPRTSKNTWQDQLGELGK